MINRSSKSGHKSRLNRKDKSSGETSTTREGNGGRLNRKDKSIDETPANRAGKYNYWIPRKTEILLNLVNVELKAKDYAIRLPDNPAKKRIEEKYFEMTGDKIIYEPEIRNRLDYMRRLRHHYNMLINRTGVRVNPTTEQIEMPSSLWDDRIAMSLGYSLLMLWEHICNGPISRRPTEVIEGALWIRVYSFRQPYMSRYWSRESTGAYPSLKYRHTHIHILLLTVLRTGKWKWRSEQQVTQLNRLIIPDRLDPMTPLTPRYPTMMHVFISRLSRLALRSYHQWVAPTRLLPHIHVDSPYLLWGLINPNSNIKEYTVHENKMALLKKFLGQEQGRYNIQQMQTEEASDDETTVGETAEDSGIRIPSEPINLLASDDEFPTREEAHRSPPRANKSILCVQSTSTKRTNRRRVNFETQIQSGFQRVEESRTNLLDVLRSRNHQKSTFGDALALLETLDVVPMGSFWWAASGLLTKDEEIRDGFMKLRSKENKIRFLERLSGVDR
ncbi:hypothetical protein YC2023_017251 [Brassica napus]